MSWLVVALVVVVIAACIALGLALWRAVTLRSKGIPVVARTLPAPDGRHWRHGVLIFTGTTAKIYEVFSIRPEPDLTFERAHTEIVGRRGIQECEARRLEQELNIVELEASGRRFELAIDPQCDTALVSWVESGPSARRDVHSGFNRPHPLDR